MRRLLLVLLVLLAAAVALVWAGEYGWGPVVITHEDEQKIVLLFGNPVSVLRKPGPSLRIPLLTQVHTFDKRLLHLNTEPLKIQTRDQEQLVVDSYVAWRISDPLRFFESFRSGAGEAGDQIDRVVLADLRKVIGQHTLSDVVTDARVQIMHQITQESDQKLSEFGIAIDDVRINRTELPPGTERSVYARMRAERESLARKYRAEGDEQARKIRAEADRQAQVIVADAQRDADVVRGDGDAQAAGIYADAYTKAPEFYVFVRRLEAYRKAIGAKTTLVLSPRDGFFRGLLRPQAGAGASTGASAPAERGRRR